MVWHQSLQLWRSHLSIKSVIHHNQFMVNNKSHRCHQCSFMFYIYVHVCTCLVFVSKQKDKSQEADQSIFISTCTSTFLLLLYIDTDQTTDNVQTSQASQMSQNITTKGLGWEIRKLKIQNNSVRPIAYTHTLTLIPYHAFYYQEVPGLLSQTTSCVETSWRQPTFNRHPVQWQLEVEKTHSHSDK